MNRTTGDFAVYAEKTVVEEVEDPVAGDQPGRRKNDQRQVSSWVMLSRCL